MTRNDWNRLLDREPGNLDCRSAFATWLIDDAGPVPCPSCEGGYKVLLRKGNVVNWRCEHCNGSGTTDRPNLLMAQCQWWMVRERKWPEHWDKTNDHPCPWFWWVRDQSEPKHAVLPKDLFLALKQTAYKSNNLQASAHRLDAELSLQRALVHLGRIAATAETQESR